MAANKTFEEILESSWEEVIRRLNYPHISKKPVIDNDFDSSADFNFSNNTCRFNKNRVEGISQELGIGIEDVLTGLSTHELGHYVFHPFDLAHAIMCQESIHHHFPDEPEEIKNFILNLFSDICLNLKYMGMERTGKELRDLYAKMESSKEMSPMIKAINSVYADRLENFTTNYKPTQDETAILEELKKVDFSGSGSLEYFHLNRFGEIILPYLKKEQQKKQGGGEGSGGKGSGEKGDKSGGQGRNAMQNGDPLSGDLQPTDLSKLTDEQLEEALNKIASGNGYYRYSRAKEFLEKQTGRKLGEAKAGKNQSSSKVAGLESSQIEWNNDLAEFYSRKARSMRIYIQQKPIITDLSDSHPAGNTPFEMSDSFLLVNPHSSPWLMPGITQRYVLAPGQKTEEVLSFPDCLISLDTSGSMAHPRNNSQAVLAAMVIAYNYYFNGCKISVNNFSADSAILFPTRDMVDVSRMLCAYWGGGTVYDVEGLKGFLKTLSLREQDEYFMGGRKAVEFSSEKDYEHLIESLRPDIREKYAKKELNVKTDQAVRKVCQKLDHIMITDGGIYNLEDVLDHMGDLSDYTRHTILVVDNPYFVQQNKHLEPKVQLYDVTKDNITDLAIGRVKRLGDGR